MWPTAASLLEREIILNVSAGAPGRLPPPAPRPPHRPSAEWHKAGKGRSERDRGRLPKGFSRAARAHWHGIPITERARVRAARVFLSLWPTTSVAHLRLAASVAAGKSPKERSLPFTSALLARH